MPRVDTTRPAARRRHEAANMAAVGEVFRAIAADVAARDEAGVGVLLPKSWDERLAEVLLERNLDCAAEFGLWVASQFDRRAAEDLDVDAMVPWLTATSATSAANINDATRAALAIEGAIVDDVTDDLLGRRLSTTASSMVTTSAGFGAKEGGNAGGATVKQWQTNSGRPRASHAAMSGATASIEGEFSNGARWPGDPVLGADGVANCMCSLVIL